MSVTAGAPEPLVNIAVAVSLLSRTGAVRSSDEDVMASVAAATPRRLMTGMVPPVDEYAGAGAASR